jgi:hypothetical protein
LGNSVVSKADNNNVVFLYAANPKKVDQAIKVFQPNTLNSWCINFAESFTFCWRAD